MAINLNSFNLEKIIKANSTPQSYQRGKEYCEEGYVSHVVNRENLLQARVEGSSGEDYSVNINFSPKGIESTFCTCPYDWEGWCKHIIATLYYCQKYSDNIQQHRSLEQLLNSLNHQQLHHLIIKLVKEEPHLIENIEEFVNRLIPSEKSTSLIPSKIDTQPIRNQVRHIIKDGIREIEEGWNEEDNITERLYDVIEDAQILVTEEDIDNALLMLEAITETCAEHWDDADDYGIDGDDVASNLDEVFAQAFLCKELSEEEKVDWEVKLNFWENEWSVSFSTSLGILAEGWGCLIQETDSNIKSESKSDSNIKSELETELDLNIKPELEIESDLNIKPELEIESDLNIKPKLELKLESESELQSENESELNIELEFQSELHLENESELETNDINENLNNDSNSQRNLNLIRLKVLEFQQRYEDYLYLAKITGEIKSYLTCLGRLGRIDTAFNEAQNIIKTIEEALALAEILDEQGETEKALAIAKLGLTKTGNFQKELAKLTVTLAENLGDKETVLMAQIKVFEAEPSENIYLKLENLAEKNWKDVKTNLLDYLTTYDGWYRKKEKVNIFLYEKLFDEAIELIEKDKYILEIDMLKKIIPYNPEWVIKKAIPLAESIMDAGKAQYYEQAVDWLTQARNAYYQGNNVQGWKNYSQELTKLHGRKYKLMGLLKSILN